MISFAMEGITSLSVKPIRWVFMIGMLMSVISVSYLLYIFIQYFMGNVITGWSSMIASTWLLGGLILFSIGLVGEYIGKIYLETKQRPRFIIEDFVGIEHENIKKDEE